MGEQSVILHDKLPLFSAPEKCEAPPPGAFMLMMYDEEETGSDASAGHSCRNMSLSDTRSLIFGSSETHDGQIFDGHKSVKSQHACLYFMKGKWFLKAIDGLTVVESITLHPYLRNLDGKAPKRYTSAGTKKLDVFSGMDPKRKLTREMCVFRLGDSGRRFWLLGTLPLGDGESEDLALDARGQKKQRREKDRKEDARRDRSPTRSRSRSRSRRRRK